MFCLFFVFLFSLDVIGLVKLAVSVTKSIFGQYYMLRSMLLFSFSIDIGLLADLLFVHCLIYYTA